MGMSTLAEIKSAIERLTPPQLAQLSRWLDEYREEAWDTQMASDADGGKFNRFKQEVTRARLRGELIDFP
jgi:hypothetical protein